MLKLDVFIFLCHTFIADINTNEDFITCCSTFNVDLLFKRISFAKIQNCEDTFQSVNLPSPISDIDTDKKDVFKFTF